MESDVYLIFEGMNWLQDALTYVVNHRYKCVCGATAYKMELNKRGLFKLPNDLRWRSHIKVVWSSSKWSWYLYRYALIDC